MPKIFFSTLLLLALLLLIPVSLQAQDNNSTGTQNNSQNDSQNDSVDSSLISQLATQNQADTIAAPSPFAQLLNGLENTINSSEIYQSIQYFWYKDIFGGFFNGISQAINQFFYDVRYKYLPAAIAYLGNIIKQFFLNTDSSQIQNTSQNSNDLAFMLTQFKDTISGIALDLSLLLFILSIWRYWVDAAWKGSSNLMSPIARLIFAIGVMLAWPTIYSFQIQLSNELINALFMDSNGNIQFLDLALTRLLESTNPSIGDIFSPTNVIALSTFGANFNFFVGILIPIVVCFLAILLICQLIYIIVLKAIQTALLTAQYVFAPIFLVLLTNPVTDGIATSYIRTFVEVSLWNFIWIGLLKILVILLYSNFNPWGKLLTAIGILQIMMDVPQFLAHAKISVASDYVSPRFFVKAAKDIAAYDKKLKGGIEVLQSLFGNSEKAGSSKASEVPNPMLKEDNFSFANDYNSNPNFLPPVRKANTEHNTNPQPNPSNQSQPNANTNGSAGSFAGAAGAAFGSTTSASISSGGSAVAISSSTSTAMALAVAIASMGDQPGATANPPQGPKSPEPPNSPNPSNPPLLPDSNPGTYIGPSNGPSGPGAYSGGPNNNPSGPSPYSGGPSNNPSGPSPYSGGPNNNPSGPSPYSGGPNNNPSGPGPYSGGPNNSPSGPGPYSGGPNNNPSGPGPYSGGPGNGFSPSPPPKRPGISPTGSGPGWPNPLCLGPYSGGPSNSPNPNFGGPGIGAWPSPNDLLINKQNPNANFIGAPELIFNQIYAYHTGAMNYHLPQEKMKSQHLFARNPFPHYNKESAKSNSTNSISPCDLIFSYGNPPTLMGIPPIYPEPNKT